MEKPWEFEDWDVWKVIIYKCERDFINFVNLSFAFEGLLHIINWATIVAFVMVFPASGLDRQSHRPSNSTIDTKATRFEQNVGHILAGEVRLPRTSKRFTAQKILKWTRTVANLGKLRSLLMRIFWHTHFERKEN